MSIFDSIKEHPYLVMGVVGGGVLLLLVINSSGSTDSTTTTDTAAASDYNSTIAQAQASIAQTQIAAQAQGEHDAASLEVAKLNASSTDLATELAAQTAQYQTGAARDVQINSDTLSAKTQMAYFDATTAQTAINAATTVQTTSVVANALASQYKSANDTTVALANINAGQNVALANINSNTQLQSQSKSCGLLGSIFGC